MASARTRIELGVGDTARSVAFYEALLGVPPTRLSPTVAVFESESPPLELMLRERPASRHRGSERAADVPLPGHSVLPPARPQYVLVVTAPEHVGTAAVALRRVGVRLRLQDAGIEADDPDGNAWGVHFVASATARSVNELSRAGERQLYLSDKFHRPR